MNKKFSSEKRYSRIMPPQLLLPIAAAGILIIILTIMFEYKSRRNDYLSLVESEAAIFLETLSNATQNALSAASELENEITGSLFAYLSLLEKLNSFRPLSEADLDEFLPETGFNEILVLNDNYSVISSAKLSGGSPSNVPEEIVEIALKKSESRSFAVLPDTGNYANDRLIGVMRTSGGRIIAGIIDQEKIMHFRRTFGFGQPMKNFSEGESVEYIILQNEQTIIAGFFEGYSLSTFNEDQFIRAAFGDKSVATREIRYDNMALLEAVSTFSYEGEDIGVFRLGLSLSQLESIDSRARKRMFIFIGLMVIFGIVFLNFILSYRHRQLLRKELSYLSSYTNTILENLESGVITVDAGGSIKVVNRKAAKFLGIDYSALYDKHYNIFPNQFVELIDDCLKNQYPGSRQENFTGEGNDESKWLSLRSTYMHTNNESDSCIVLVDDITEQVQLEEQIRRNEKLTAMRKLASAVAHEIRNPLNSIMLIVDLLKMNFVPVEKTEKYEKYIDTVQKEIRRISSIVDEFLRFARPPKLSPESIDFREFFSDIDTLYGPRTESEGISMSMDLQPHPEFTGDIEQLKQLFVNLIENAIQAISGTGKIEVKGVVSGDYYKITVDDSGGGISPGDIEHIFDIYYTTKKTGSGIGLAVVQQIISSHGGMVNVESREGEGAKFAVLFPLSPVNIETE